MLNGHTAPLPLSRLHQTLRTLERHFVAKFVNEIVNHPSVAPHVLLTHEEADLTAVVADPANVVLVADHGAIVFQQLQPGLFEAHTQVLPSGRGEWGRWFVLAALHWLFCSTTAVEVVTRVPQGNVPARAGMRVLERVFGPLHELRREEGWFRDGEPIPADVYSLPINKWLRAAPGLTERGQWFHDKLEAEYEKVGKKHLAHADDGVHDRAVGAACEMIWGGQVQKALVFYNRWALIAGYAPIRVVSEQPLALDIRDAILVVRPSEQNFWMVAG